MLLGFVDSGSRAQTDFTTKPPHFRSQINVTLVAKHRFRLNNHWYWDDSCDNTSNWFSVVVNVQAISNHYTGCALNHFNSFGQEFGFSEFSPDRIKSIECITFNPSQHRKCEMQDKSRYLDDPYMYDANQLHIEFRKPQIHTLPLLLLLSFNKRYFGPLRLNASGAYCKWNTYSS